MDGGADFFGYGQAEAGIGDSPLLGRLPTTLPLRPAGPFYRTSPVTFFHRRLHGCDGLVEAEGMTDDGTGDGAVLGFIDRVGLDGRIIRERESPATLTCLALATFYDMNENDETEYDDDYSKEQHLDLKALEGWTYCEECGDRIHLNDLREGASCSCEDDGKAHPMTEHMRVLGEILANKARKSDE